MIEEEPEGDATTDPPGTQAPRTGLQRRLQRTCRAAARGVGADGAGVCLWAGEGGLMTAAASDDHFLQVEDLQFTVGEGPCLTAHAERAPVLLPDLRETWSTAWSTYPRAALELGVRAVFAFPLQLGDVRLGVLDVYRETPGALTARALSLATTFAEVTFLDLLDDMVETEDPDELVDSVAANRYEIFQAQGMVMVQLGVSATDALLRLRAHAFATGLPLAQIARDVIARRTAIGGQDDDSH